MSINKHPTICAFLQRCATDMFQYESPVSEIRMRSFIPPHWHKYLPRVEEMLKKPGAADDMYHYLVVLSFPEEGTIPKKQNAQKRLLEKRWGLTPVRQLASLWWQYYNEIDVEMFDMFDGDYDED